MDKVAAATSVKDELEACLMKLEELNALMAAAHLDAAINALCDELGLSRGKSDPE
ncbi:hypothetical protein [Novosphingobium album (ex Hu et al. 2023)]|uniref:hypothetical protein n=1 Tax=Novosphingobium album (ex Hu et al. 2023) TaxID=2930093 RepID=UPI001FBB41D8|nr:hypothetical protein [Novosphingobium album (ex Hu et al. 2023)]